MAQPQPQPQPSPPTGPEIAFAAERPRARDIAVLVAATLPLYVNLTCCLWGSENRWVLIAQSMLESGDWLDPRLQGEFYGDKPLLSYWVIVLAALPFGEVTEAIARLPSAVSGTLTVLITGWMAARLLGRQYVLASGLTLATAFSFVYWARSASADLLNLLFVAAATAVYIEGVVRFRRSMLLWFFALLALGGHAKGSPAIIVPLALVGGDILLSRRWALLRQWRWIVAGATLGATLYLVPFVISWLDRGDWKLLGLMWHENFVRAFDAFDHRGSVFLYVYTLPPMLLPWSLWLPGALGWAGTRWRSSPGLRFALTAFVVIFLLFTASESRRSYYILPIFPYAAILIGAFLRDLTTMTSLRRTAATSAAAATAPESPVTSPSRLWPWLGLAPIWILAFGAIITGVGALIALVSPGAIPELALQVPWLAPLALALVAAGLTTVVLMRQRRHRNAIHVEMATVFVLLIFVFTSVQHLRDSLHAEFQFAERFHREYAGREFFYFTGSSGRLIYYVDPESQRIAPDQLLELLESRSGEETLIICGRHGVRWLEQNRGKVEWTELFRVESLSLGELVEPRVQCALISCRGR